MDDERWSLIEELVRDSDTLTDEQRQAFLDDRCGSDSRLRAEVRSYMEAQDVARTYLQDEVTRTEPHQPAGDPRAGVPPERTRFRLVSKLGEGGMGQVYLAQQEHPICRQAAVKILKPGMDSRQIVARFEAERQALAMMNHPGIAKVFDAGATRFGHPYFVMEYVEGTLITEYCDEHELDLRARLEVFSRVCQGVQHAHEKGIIHRDLKPANILVSEVDGVAAPKIIDFGVAKAIQSDSLGDTSLTRAGQLIGTPAYMSPEQVDGSTLGVDTRSDTYSLGLILYELLVGDLPYDRKTIAGLGMEGFRRLVLEGGFSNPSARLSSIEEPAKATRKRGGNPSSLRRALQGDLDWIVMKALARERADRYSSPLELAADIERYLTNQPVTAGPPTLAYRASKFVRRHTVGVALAAASTVLVIGFVATLVVQADRIVDERDRANQEASVSGQALGFLDDVFKSSDPRESGSGEVTVQALLQRGVAQIDERFLDADPIRIRLLVTMGSAYRGLAQFDKARPLLEEALELSRQSPENTRQLTRSLDNLGWLLYDLGDTAGAEKLIEEELAIRQRTSGHDDPSLATALSNLGGLKLQRKDYDGAIALAEQALAMQEARHGRESLEVASALHSIATAYWQKRDYSVARPYAEESLAIHERELGPTHPMTAEVVNSMAIILEGLGELSEARTYYLRSLEIREESFGPDHPTVAMSLNNYAQLLHELGELDEAIPLLRRSLAIVKETYGNNHPNVAKPMLGLAVVLLEQGEYDEAIDTFKRSHEILRTGLGPEHPAVGSTLRRFRSLLRERGQSHLVDDLTNLSES